MQPQRLIFMVFQIITHGTDTQFHQRIGAGDQRRQEAGAAGAFVGLLHNVQGADRDIVLIVIKLYAAAAVDLQINKSRGEDGTAQITGVNSVR